MYIPSGELTVIPITICHCLVALKVREGLAVSKQAAQTFDVERFNLRKLDGLEIRKQYQIGITNRYAA